jgi:hypothetical protein
MVVILGRWASEMASCEIIGRCFCNAESYNRVVEAIRRLWVGQLDVVA